MNVLQTRRSCGCDFSYSCGKNAVNLENNSKARLNEL
jgi:hypothetical protein